MALIITRKCLERHTAVGNDLIYVKIGSDFTIGCLGQTSKGRFFINPIDYFGNSVFLSDKRLYVRNGQLLYFPRGDAMRIQSFFINALKKLSFLIYLIQRLPCFLFTNNK